VADDWAAPTDHVARIFTAGVVRSMTHPEMVGVRTMATAIALKAGEDFTHEHLIALAFRGAVNVYLEAAGAIGLFRGSEGKKLRRNLTANNPHNYRGALKLGSATAALLSGTAAPWCRSLRLCGAAGRSSRDHTGACGRGCRQSAARGSRGSRARRYPSTEWRSYWPEQCRALCACGLAVSAGKLK